MVSVDRPSRDTIPLIWGRGGFVVRDSYFLTKLYSILEDPRYPYVLPNPKSNLTISLT
jgi:hypothetical protein